MNFYLRNIVLNCPLPFQKVQTYLFQTTEFYKQDEPQICTAPFSFSFVADKRISKHLIAVNPRKN